MIIDVHVHTGSFIKEMPIELILDSMEKYNIDFSLVSNDLGVEVDHAQDLIEKQTGQIELNLEMIDYAKAYPRKIGALLWIKPRTEGCNKEFDKLIATNREYIYGLKVHPYHSKMAFNSNEVNEYIKLAQKYSLPVVTHTANDYDSSPDLVYEVASNYPDVNFVMYHMGLGTDHNRAIELISKLPNLYGDTSWVKKDITLKAISKCGIDKILFGTDNPINGINTYGDDRFYTYYFKDMKHDLSIEDYNKFMYKNAAKLFGINI